MLQAVDRLLEVNGRHMNLDLSLGKNRHQKNLVVDERVWRLELFTRRSHRRCFVFAPPRTCVGGVCRGAGENDGGFRGGPVTPLGR